MEEGLRGSMGSMQAFKEKVLYEGETNSEDLRHLEYLETKAAAVYSDTLDLFGNSKKLPILS